jgi:hypothetical protein
MPNSLPPTEIDPEKTLFAVVIIPRGESDQAKWTRTNAMIAMGGHLWFPTENGGRRPILHQGEEIKMGNNKTCVVTFMP